MGNLRSGYNFVERNLIGTKVQDCPEVMSAVQFLRLLQRGEPPPREVKVTGFGELLIRLQDREGLRLLRRIFFEAGDLLMRRGTTVLFPVDRLVLDAEPFLEVGEERIRLYALFSKGLEQEAVGHFYSPFNV